MSFQGTSGALSHSVSLNLAIAAAPLPLCGLSYPLPRIGFYRLNTSSVSSIYDPVRKLFFVSSHDKNSVEVFSSTTLNHLASIAVAQPYGLDLSADGNTVIVGSTAAVLTLIDPDLLQVKSRITVPPTGIYQSSLPFFPVATSNGSVLIATGSTAAIELILLQWNPETGQFLDRTPQQLNLDVGLIGRSGDHSKVLVTSGDSAGKLALYDAATDSFTKFAAYGGFISYFALNSNGTQIAGGFGNSLVILDQNLQEVSTSGPLPSGSLIYSLDNQYLYNAAEGIDIIQVLRASDLSTLGQVSSIDPDTQFSSYFGPFLQAIDETGMLVVGGYLGVGFIDASQPASSMAAIRTVVRLPNALDPPQGALNTPAPTSFNGANFPNCAAVFFGGAQGTGSSVQSSNVVNVTPPPSSAAGPVNVTAFFPDGSFLLAPDGFTYGPAILYLSQTGGAPSGGTSFDLMGYGFDFDASSIQVSIGGKAATIQSVSPYPGITPFTFPVHHIKLTTPAGQPGPADVTVTTPAGSTTLHGGFNYFQQTYTAGASQGIAAILYDRFRRRVYLSDQLTNSINVFSLDQKSLLPDLPSGKGPVDMALTPDGSKLVVTNYLDKTLTIVDPDSPSSVATVQVVPTSSQEIPVAVATTSTGQAFVQMTIPSNSGCTGELREVDLSTLAVSLRSVAPCLSESFFLRSTGDGSRVYLAVGESLPGATYVWDAESDSFTAGPSLSGQIVDLAVSSDGNRVSTSGYILDSQLNVTGFDSIPYLLQDANGLLFSQKLDPSGSLVYIPFPGYIDIFDAQTGNLRARIALPSQLQDIYDAFAVDETGSEIFALTQNGLTIIQLTSAPLGIGSVTPSSGPLAGGTPMTIRGSGFRLGITVKLGNQPAVATLTDSETLTVTSPASSLAGPAQITITNADGTHYSLDADFQYTSQ